MKQGDKGDHMYIILSGQANIHIANTTSFKSVVHAIQHTRMWAKMASSNAESKTITQADGLQPQSSLSKATSLVELAGSPSLQALAGECKALFRYAQTWHEM